MKPVRGVLLDIDGTLVESNDAHAEAWVRALAEAGFQVPLSAVRPLIGMGSDKLLPKVCGLELDSPDGKQISERRAEIFKKEYLPHLRPTKGASELLHHLSEIGVHLSVATSAKKEELDQLLKICGADSLIKSATTSDDAERSKPDPDIVHAALKEIALPPDEVAFLGDTPYDVQAAHKAGLRAVAVRCGGWGDADLKADAVYDDPGDVLKHVEDAFLAHA
jgi:HAD superfamily hydrolase (TIGR01509 family)